MRRPPLQQPLRRQRDFVEFGLRTEGQVGSCKVQLELRPEHEFKASRRASSSGAGVDDIGDFSEAGRVGQPLAWGLNLRVPDPLVC
jgi:hypothetical protein